MRRVVSAPKLEPSPMYKNTCRLFFRSLQICKVSFESASDTYLALLVSFLTLNFATKFSTLGFGTKFLTLRFGTKLSIKGDVTLEK